MSDLIDTTEMYLKTVFELEEEGILPMRARIAERLGHSGPTVSQTVARLERDGLMVVSGDRHLELTDLGRERATHVMRKHRLAERLLVDVIGLDWPHVHEEACRWEHVMSERVERRLVGLLGQPHHDPYGNPIPGLSELGVDEAPGQAVQNAVTAADAAPATVRLVRVGEPLQVDVDLLSQLEQHGIQPGVEVRLRREGGSVVVGVEGQPSELELGTDLAKHLFVAAP